jgi:molecular chaperone GrpE
VLMQSFDLLAQQLLGELKNIGLEKMHPKGEIFNPELHEAISQVENPDVPDHTIIDVYKDGYTLHDRVLRPAQVVVAVNPQPSSKSQESGQAASNDEFAPQQPRKDKNPFQQTTP